MPRFPGKILGALASKSGPGAKKLATVDPAVEPMYAELLQEYPQIPPKAIEAALQFLKVATSKHLHQEALFSQYGLTTGRFNLLMYLRREPTRQLSPSELAKRANVSRATMTQFIDALEKEQFIRRVDDPNDRRAMLIQLTPKAEETLKKVLPQHLTRLADFTSRLTRAERMELFRLLDKCSEE